MTFSEPLRALGASVCVCVMLEFGIYMTLTSVSGQCLVSIPLLHRCPVEKVY